MSKPQRTLNKTLAAALLAACAAAPAVASTDEPSGINLGSTSFNVAFGLPQPGWVYEQYFQYFSYNGITDASGKKLGAPVFNHQNINAIVSLNQLIYLTPIQLLGGNIGLTALLPLVNVASHNDEPAYVSLKSNGFGIGDLTFGAALQYPPVIRNGRPIFVQRFECDVLAPIGSYNTAKDINQSAGFWSVNPYYNYTFLPYPGVEVSQQIFYLHNFANNNPASSTPLPPGSSFRAGDAVWTNFAASYSVTPGLELGINGYAFQQIQQDTTDGITQSHSLTENVSVGPGLSYAVNQANLLFANAYLPVVEKNTTDGFHLVFRWVHFF